MPGPFLRPVIGRATAAFTLVEALIVVSVIGLLAAILLPSLAASRHHARLLKCSANLHQLGTSLNAYVADNRDFFPLNIAPWNVSMPTLRGLGISPDRSPIWIGSLQKWMGVQGPPWLRGLACPSALSTLGHGTDAARPEDMGSAWVLNTYCSARQLSTIPRPGDGVLLVENGTWSYMSEDAGDLEQPTHPRFYPHPAVSQEDHAGVAWNWPYGGHKRNILWVDGHVTAVVARRWPGGHQTLDADRIRHMRFGLPGTHPFDP
jgi:prepilin-type processing-associated H-X9-DG protein